MRPKRFRVLIAEDDPDDLELIARAFEKLKARYPVRLTAVPNGVQLLDYLLQRGVFKEKTIRPHLILLDVNMPVMDGFDVLREISRHPALRRIPVCVLSSSRNRDQGDKALKLGAVAVLQKGSTQKELFEAVSQICSEHLSTSKQSGTS